jgi:hypothetical protein
MPHTLLSYLAIGMLIAACIFALLKGDVAERFGGLLIFLSWAAEYTLSLFFSGFFTHHDEELILLVTDAALALGLLVLAFRFAKLWLGLAMLMLSGELALHGAAMGAWELRFRSYIYINNGLSYGLVLLLMFATATAWAKRADSPRKERKPAPPDTDP